MADVQAEEIEYWRREYGIHLIGYTTILDPISGIRNHNPLLTLLEDLAESPVIPSRRGWRSYGYYWRVMPDH